MEKKKLRFAIFGNEYQARKATAIQKVLSVLEQLEAMVYIDRPFYEFITKELCLTVDVADVFDDDNFDVDFAISLGGDGTFLKAASRVGSKKIPVIGVNMGRLGFLADVLPSEAETVLTSIAGGSYEIEEHSAIEIETDGERLTEIPWALNDIAILKRDNASMISIRTSIDDEYLVTYQADGLIVSTPTGSTAYSLSNGGPIIVPQTDTLCLTPVAPHSLNIRPIVISGSSEVTLSVVSRSHNYLVAIDGRSESLSENTRVTIRRAPFTVRIVRRSGNRYFSTLREKMMWGSDVRNC